RTRNWECRARNETVIGVRDSAAADKPDARARDICPLARASGLCRCQAARSTRQVLLPPKPKELETATRTAAGRASWATWQRLHSGSGSSRLMVGGRAPRRMAATQARASTAAAAVSRWPVMLLVELTGTRGQAPPSTAASTLA